MDVYSQGNPNEVKLVRKRKAAFYQGGSFFLLEKIAWREAAYDLYIQTFHRTLID